MRRETQQSIHEWQKTTFGQVKSKVRVVGRAFEEMEELLCALSADDQNSKAGEEVADIVIILYGLAQELGIDLLAEIDRKMAINRARTWRNDGFGHGYHVRE